MAKVFTAKSLLLLAFAFLLASCGSDNQNNQQSKEPLRLNLQPPAAYIDDPYNYALSADGGVRPYRYIMDGNLPKGLSYSDGRITGTPQEKGTYELTFTVEDSNLSSRVQKATLTVGDTPPPQLEVKYPLASEVDAPFVYAFNIRARESKGFRLQIPLKDLKPTLDSLKANENLLYVIRYDETKGLVDIDAVFTQPRKDLEAFRLNFAPLEGKKVRPQDSFIQSKIVLFDRKGQMVVNSPSIQRTASQGKYKYSDLEAIARNWGKKIGTSEGVAPAPATPQSPAQGQTPATPDQPKPPTSDPTTPPQQDKGDATPPAQDQSKLDPNTQPAQGQPSQPAQGQPDQPTTPGAAQGQPTEGQPAAPAATDQPMQPTGDANQPDPSKDPASPTLAPAPPSETKTESPANPDTSKTTTDPAKPTTPDNNPPAKDATATTPAQTPAGQTQPTTPTPKDAQNKNTSGLEGDLNGDGSVDQKDLEALRASYTWENVTGATPPNPTNPAPQTPSTPNSTQNPPTNPPRDPATPNPQQP